jgi:hypothetical protein
MHVQSKTNGQQWELSSVSAEKTAPFVVKDLDAAAELAQTLGVSCLPQM